jgi:hypothetical protein
VSVDSDAAPVTTLDRSRPTSGNASL